MTLANILLVIIAITSILTGALFLRGKAEKLLLWRFTGKELQIEDLEGYRKQQGKHAIVMGAIFLLVPVSITLVKHFGLDPRLLRLWYVPLFGAILYNGFVSRRYMK